MAIFPSYLDSTFRNSTSVDDLCNFLYSQLLKKFKDHPTSLTLVGHSLGGAMIHKLAQMLEKQSLVQLNCLISIAAPALYEPGPDLSDIEKFSDSTESENFVKAVKESPFTSHMLNEFLESITREPLRTPTMYFHAELEILYKTPKHVLDQCLDCSLVTIPGATHTSIVLSAIHTRVLKSHILTYLSNK